MIMKMLRDIKLTQSSRPIGENSFYMFNDWEGCCVNVYFVNGGRVIRFLSYESIHAALHDRTEELAAANKATEMERSALDRSEATLKAEREAHDETKASLSEWTSASHQLDTKRELAAARKEFDFEKRTHRSTMDKLREAWREIKALKEGIKESVTILQTHLKMGAQETTHYVTIANCYETLLSLVGEKKEAPAPAPVEYACPYCGGKVKEINKTELWKSLMCEECHARSNEYNKFRQETPHESWIKKQEEPTA